LLSTTLLRYWVASSPFEKGSTIARDASLPRSQAWTRTQPQALLAMSTPQSQRNPSILFFEERVMSRQASPETTEL
jgi:hypothetical protein